jgi:beta-glucosidase
VSIPNEHRTLAKESATEACVLLKNDGALLPLPKTACTVALVGPYANDRRNPLGSWTLDGREEDTVTLAQGLRQADPALRLIEPELDSLETAAKDADFVIAAIGEHWDDSGESRGSARLSIPEEQIALLERVYAANPKTIVVLSSGRPLVLDRLLENCSSLLLAWHGGTMAGAALSELILGERPPSGKLPVSFPRAASQLPLYYNHRAAGRDIDEYYGPAEYPGYKDLPGGPRFPFGYGLSYTEFEYSGLSAEAQGATVSISALVRNIGESPGTEVVQCYASVQGGGFSRPVRELIGYQHILLDAGEDKKVCFSFELPSGAHSARFYVGGDSVSAKEVNTVPASPSTNN